MKTLQRIVIKETEKTEYQSTITLGNLANIRYCVIVTTNHLGVVNQFVEQFDTYKEALHSYLENVQEYAKHTALMNL